MLAETVMSMLETVFENDDADQADKVLELYAGDWEGPKELELIALEKAVEKGCAEFVEEHMENFDTYEMGYLMDLGDEDMQRCLSALGVCHSFDWFEGFRFAAETVNDTVLSFTPAFQREVWESCLNRYGLSESEAAALFEEDGEVDEETEEFLCAAELLKASAENGEIVLGEFGDMDDEVSGCELTELIEELGYGTEFEGDTWKLETNGVNFIR